MKLDKILRVLVCLALVCCIILNVAAMPARASTVGEWFAYQVGTDIGITAILEGFGVFRDAADDYFDELRTNVKNYLVSGDYVKDDLMTAYYFQSPLPQAASFYAFGKSMVEVVRQFLFDEKIVSSGVNLSPDYPDSVTSALARVQSYPFYYVGYEKDGGLVMGGSNFPFSSGTDKNGYYVSNSGGSYQAFRESWDWSWVNSNKIYVNSVSLYETGVNDNEVVANVPVVLGHIPSLDIPFTNAYPQWITHDRTLSNGSIETMVQIGLGNTLEETEQLTQEQIWAGQGQLQIPEQGQVNTPVTLPGWLQQGLDNLRLGLQDILSTLKQLPQLLAQELAKIFVPSQDYITVKVDALRGEFGFIDSVIATGEFIRDSVSGASGPPAIYVNLGNAPSGNYGSQRVLLTDFSWYAPYKSQVDSVLSAALWAFFGWRVFLKLPGIIGGESGYVTEVFFSSSSSHSGSDDKKKGGKK